MLIRKNVSNKEEYLNSTRDFRLFSGRQEKYFGSCPTKRIGPLSV